MKPLNNQERRSAFWKFTLLFLLAIAPICAAIYMYGKVDKAENTFLRKEYDTKKHQAVQNQEYEDARAELILKADKIREYFASDPNISNLDPGSIRTVEAKYSELNKAKEKFKVEVVNLGLSTEPDVSALLDIAGSYELTLQSFSNIYKLGSEEIKDKERDLKKAKEDLREYQGTN